MKINLTKREIEALMNLLGQVQIRAVAPDSVEHATLYRDLGKKFTDAMQAIDADNGWRPLEAMRSVDEEHLKQQILGIEKS